MAAFCVASSLPMSFVTFASSDSSGLPIHSSFETGSDQSTSLLAFHWFSLPFSYSARSSETSLPYSQWFHCTCIGVVMSIRSRMASIWRSSAKSTSSNSPSLRRFSCMNLSIGLSCGSELSRVWSAGRAR